MNVLWAKSSASCQVVSCWISMPAYYIKWGDRRCASEIALKAAHTGIMATGQQITALTNLLTVRDTLHFLWLLIDSSEAWILPQWKQWVQIDLFDVVQFAWSHNINDCMEPQFLFLFFLVSFVYGRDGAIKLTFWSNNFVEPVIKAISFFLNVTVTSAAIFDVFFNYSGLLLLAQEILERWRATQSAHFWSSKCG